MSKRKKSSDKRAAQAQLTTSVFSAQRLGVSAGVVLIVIAAFIAYSPSINGGFIWDDDGLLTENNIIKASNGLYRFWCTTEPFDYWPLTNTSLWIEWRMWEMHSTGYHVTNLIMHIIESLLIWVILRKLSIPGAFLAAVIFAVHPVNVESVAWISQRKDTMAMLFFLLSILWYLKHISSRHTPSAAAAHGVCGVRDGRWYWLSLLAFVLALLGKGSVAILPLLLVGIIWWLRENKGDEKKGTVPFDKRGTVPLFSDLVQTAPFFAVAAVMAGVNVWFQAHIPDTVHRIAGFTERLLGAGGAVWFYLYKALWPVDLSFVYPLWRIEPDNWLWWLPLLAALLTTALLWRYRESTLRPLAFAWYFFCVALAPVMGFTNVGFMRYSLVADRYQHIAIIAVIALAAALWSFWRKRTRESRPAATVVALAAVGALALLTWRQCGIYRDAVTLYEATLAKNPECWMAHYNLGIKLSDAGRVQDAMDHYQEALRINPNLPEPHDSLGNILLQAGRTREAIDHYRQALRLDPNFVEAYNSLGVALGKTGQPKEAIECFRQAIHLNPYFSEAENNLGNALVDAGRPQEAIEHYKQALRINPNYPNAENNLGEALIQAGLPQEAIEHFQQALRLKSDFTAVYFNLAAAYAKMQRSSEAVAAARKALQLARSQGQTALAKQIEDWLNSYRGGLPE